MFMASAEYSRSPKVVLREGLTNPGPGGVLCQSAPPGKKVLRV